MNSTKIVETTGPVLSSIDALVKCIPAQGIDFGYCSVAQETCRKIILDSTVPRSVTATAVRYTIETDSANFQLSHLNGKHVSNY